MEWGVFLEPVVLPQLVAVGLMWTLAVALLRLDFHHPAHRVFATILLLRGLSMLAALLRDVFGFYAPYLDPDLSAYWARLLPYFIIPLPFLVLRFASIYPQRRGWFARPAGHLTLLALIGLLELAYLLDHGLWARTVPTVIGGQDGSLYLADGPLAALLGIMWLVFGGLVLLFARDHARMHPGPRRRALLIVLVGFALNTVYESTGSWVALAAGAAPQTSALVQWTLRLALLPILAAVVILARDHARTPDAGDRLALRRSLQILPLPALSVVLLYLLTGPLGIHPVIGAVFAGFWRLTLPALVTYALLRFQLFDLDLKIKFAVKHTALAGVFVFILAVTTEVLEGFLTDGQSAGLGITVAVGLTYLVTPVQRLAERLADRAMPATADTPEFRKSKRLEVYRATLERALVDSVLTRNELRILDYLRVELGLTAEEVQELETQVATDAGLPGLPPGLPAANAK